MSNIPKEKRTEPGEIHPKYWEKTVREAFKYDSLRIIIELLKNSADSYTRLEKQTKQQPPFEIFLRIFCRKRSPPTIEVCDHAEGMDSNKLREALKYGTQLSMGEDVDAITSAEKGIGLKDALMALENNWLITIKNGLINERNKHIDFTTGIGKEDENVTIKERKDLQIPGNGTFIRGKLPKFFRFRPFSTICERLQRHFLMRKLLQLTNYKIYAIDGWNNEKRLLSYEPPNIQEEVLFEELNIKHEGKEYPITITINKAEKELDQGKPFGQSGLLFFYGKYTVVDFSLCRFDRELSFSNIFGEIKMAVDTLIRDPQEVPLVDEKRRGLDLTHPFNAKLIQIINDRLKVIQDQEESSRYKFNEESKRQILNEINKIYKNIKGKGQPPEPPIIPEFFEFHPPFVSIMEYEPKTVVLIINSSIIIGELNIKIKSNNPKIIMKPQTIKIKQQYSSKEKYIIKRIQIFSDEVGTRGEITAKSELPEYYSKIGVEVIGNPIFSPENGFAFVPNKTSIVDGGTKKVILCIDTAILRPSRVLEFISQHPITCPGKRTLPNNENIKKKLMKHILKCEIPIEVKETGHIGERATIVAMYSDRTCSIDVTIIPEPSIGGLLRNIRFSEKDTKKISDFVEELGILEVYRKHSLIKKYMQGDFRRKTDFLVFVADVITRETIKAFVSGGVRENSSRFPLFYLDIPEERAREIENHIAREYYEHGLRMHALFVGLLRSLTI